MIYPQILTKMKILVIGNGGREHTLVWKLRQSARVSEIFCVPGNGGICAEATCMAGDPKNIEGLLNLAHQLQPDITVVGPELPLSLGLVDELLERGRPFREAAEAAIANQIPNPEDPAKPSQSEPDTS